MSVPSETVAQFEARMTARPVVPTSSPALTHHVGRSDLPWAERADGTAIQLLHVDLNQGIWVINARLPTGYTATTHFHTGQVYAVTLQGRWFYAETPDAMNSPGSYLFEPAGSVHTLCTPADQDGPTIVWFAIYGANLNMDDVGTILSISDAHGNLEYYRGYCEARDLDHAAMIVVGEV